MTTLSFRSTLNIGVVNPAKSAPRQTTGDAIAFTISGGLGGTASVTVDLPNGTVGVLLPDVEIGEEMWEWLKTADAMYANNYPAEFAAQIEAINQEMLARAKTVVEHVKYYLGLDEIADDAVAGVHGLAWACESGIFKAFPNLVSGAIGIKNSMPLNDQTRAALQEGLDQERKPFLAMRHLYRAMQEKSPRFKWIDATIAAELAIKEYLARAHPELEVLLIHVPSPPLSKLYGEILQKCAGERSPYRKALDLGAQKRNQLVHQPHDVTITELDAFVYVNTVMKAIHHLYALLYPNWSITHSLKNFERIGM